MPRNISWSEIKTFKRCRKLWYWQYDRFLEPRIVESAPLLGRLGHGAFAELFRGRDYREYIRKWLDEATETHVDLTMDGEWEESAEIEAEWEEMAFVVEGILDRYAKDSFLTEYKVVATEHEFHIPLPAPLEGYTLHGFIDAVLEDYDGKHWLYERKFVQYDPKRKRYGSFRKPEQLEMDGQIGFYDWALRMEGYDLAGSIHEQILGTLPRVPKLLKKGNSLNGGKISVARCRTDWETYSAFVELNGEDPNDYLAVKEELDRNEFFRRTTIYRGEEEVNNFLWQMLHHIQEVKGYDALRDEGTDLEPYAYMVLDQGCASCPFKPLCFEKLKGRDPEPIIEQEYQPRKRMNAAETEEIPDEGVEEAPEGEGPEEEAASSVQMDG